MDGKNYLRGRLLTIREAAPLLGYARQTIYNRVGELTRLSFYRIGRSIRYAEANVEVFLKQRRVEPQGGE